MTTPALRSDYDVFDLTGPKVVQLHPEPTPAAVLAEPDALQEPKKNRPGRKKGSKNKPKKTRKAKAPTVPATVPESPRTTTNMLSAGGDAGPRMWWRRINSDGWLVIVALATALALGSGIAYAVIR